jgi:hypothetical protein
MQLYTNYSDDPCEFPNLWAALVNPLFYLGFIFLATHIIILVSKI